MKNKITEQIIEIIEKNSKEKYYEPVLLKTELEHLIKDSLMWIKIIVEVETEFGIEFDDEKLLMTEFPQLNELVEYVCHKIKEY